MWETRDREAGATAVEYALMVALIAVVILGAVTTLGRSLFGEDVEVLGNVLTRDSGDGDPAPTDPDEPADGPPCHTLPDEAKPPHCT